MLWIMLPAAQLFVSCAGYGDGYLPSWTYSDSHYINVLAMPFAFTARALSVLALAILGARDHASSRFERRRTRHVSPRRLPVLRHMGSRDRPDLRQDRYCQRRAPLRTIDLDHDPDPPIARSRILYTPTFVLVEDGKEVGRIEGYPGDAVLLVPA